LQELAGVRMQYEEDQELARVRVKVQQRQARGLKELAGYAVCCTQLCVCTAMLDASWWSGGLKQHGCEDRVL
jgi:hypothetical protein